eukprot:567084-Pyramimonas_sp.AAC.1
MDKTPSKASAARCPQTASPYPRPFFCSSSFSPFCLFLRLSLLVLLLPPITSASSCSSSSSSTSPSSHDRPGKPLRGSGDNLRGHRFCMGWWGCTKRQAFRHRIENGGRHKTNHFARSSCLDRPSGSLQGDPPSRVLHLLMPSSSSPQLTCLPIPSLIILPL